MAFLGASVAVRDTITTDLAAGLPSPLTCSSIEEVYEIFKGTVRPADDSAKDEAFTYFTFVVNDQECLQADPYQYIVYNDAPDYREAPGTRTIKILRLPLKAAAFVFLPFEQLVITLSEAISSDSECLCSTPPFTVKESREERNCYILATPAEARRHKEQALRLFTERPDKALQRTLDPERRAVIFECSRDEAKTVSHLWQQTECMLRNGEAAVMAVGIKE